MRKYKYTLTEGFSIVAADFPTVLVPGALCIKICNMDEVHEWRKSHSDNGLSTKIVDIILRDGAGKWMTKEDIDRIKKIRERSAAADAIEEENQPPNSALIQTMAKEIVSELKEHYNFTIKGPWVGALQDPQRVVELCLVKRFPQSAVSEDMKIQQRIAAKPTITKFPIGSLGKPVKIKGFPKKEKPTISQGLRGMKSPDGREFL